MKHFKKAIAICAALVLLPSIVFAEDNNPLSPSYRRNNSQPSVNVDVDVDVNAKGTVIQKPVLNQTQTGIQYQDQTAIVKQNPIIVQKPVIAPVIKQNATTVSGSATTNSGNIANTANGGEGGKASATIQKGAVQNMNNVAGSTATIAKGAVNNTVTGGSSTIEKGAVVNNNSTSSAGGSAVIQDGANQNTNSNNADGGNVEKGAVSVNIDNSQHNAAAPHAIATPVVGAVMAPVNATSFYQAGLPNAVGANAVVGLYEDQCTTAVSGNDNVVHAETKYEKFTLVLDDQGKVRNGKTPTVQLVKLPQSTGIKSGQCICLGTLQVEALPMPETGRGSNRQTLHVAAAQFIARNLRLSPGSGNVKLLYAEHSITLNKGTEVYANSKGIGGGGSATFGSNVVGAVAPSFGSSGGYSTDYAMVGVTYFIVSDASTASEEMRTLDIARFANEISRLPQPQWNGANATPPTVQASQVK